MNSETEVEITESGVGWADTSDPRQRTVIDIAQELQNRLYNSGSVKYCPCFSITDRCCLDDLLNEFINEVQAMEDTIEILDMINRPMLEEYHEQAIRRCGTEYHCDGSKVKK